VVRSLPKLGSLFDRAAHILVINARSFAICMSPAVALSLVAWTLKPGALTAESIQNSNGDISAYIRVVYLYAGASSVAAFSQWVCAATVMIGMRWAERGYSPRPLTWLAIGTRRIPSLLITFLLPIVPALIPFCLLILTVLDQYRMVGDINSFDPASFAAGVQAARQEIWAVALLGLIGVPFSFLATAGVMLGDYTARRAIRWAMCQTFSRVMGKRVIALSCAVIAVLVAHGMMETVADFATEYVPSAVIIWHFIEVVADAAFDAYIAAVIALAWLTEYLAP